MIVFALRAFCFELSIVSSTVDLLYSPQALQNWSQSCRGWPTSCICPGLSLKKLVFVLRIFCFELLTPSSTVDLLYSP